MAKNTKIGKTAKTATNKNSKISAYESTSLFITLCAIAALVFIVAIITMFNSTLTPNNPTIDSNPTINSSPQEPITESSPVLYPITAGAPNEGAIEIAVDDSGYTPKTLILTPSVSTYLEITNKGVNNHSFVIDELTIDTGEIKPGETRTLILPNLPNESYEYVFILI